MATSNQKARVVFLNSLGGAEVLKVNSIDMPVPKDNEVLINVKSFGLNRTDAAYRMGFFSPPTSFPAKIGFEAAGTIESTGASLQQAFAKGDRVNVIPAFSMSQYGTYGDYILSPGYAVRKIPDTLPFDEAAALWLSYLTMYGMIVDAAAIKKGDYVAINAASSSTGLAAIQLVNYCGGIPIALTTSPKKSEALLAAGAISVINTSEDNFHEQVLQITNKKGVNLILDPVVGKNFHKLLHMSAESGKVFVYAVMSREDGIFQGLPVLSKKISIKGFRAEKVVGNPEKLAKAVDFIFQGVADGVFKPKIDRTFRLDDIVAAHQYMESNSQFGKIIVNP